MVGSASRRGSSRSVEVDAGGSGNNPYEVMGLRGSVATTLGTLEMQAWCANAKPSAVVTHTRLVKDEDGLLPVAGLHKREADGRGT